MIEITEDKLDGLYENAEKMLKYGGKLMSCLDELKQDSQDRYGERNRMPDYRGRGGRGGMREHEDYEERERRERMERDMPDYRGGSYRGGY